MAPRPQSDARSARIDSAAARRTLAQLWPFLAPYTTYMVGAFLALVGATMATLVVPFSVRMVIDQGFAGENGMPLGGVFTGLVIVVAVLALMSGLRFYLVTWIGERVVADLRAAVFSRIMRFDQSFHDRARAGELISRLTSDATQMKQVVGSTLSIALRNAFLFFGSAIMMVVTSPTLSGAVLVAIPLVILPLVVFGRKVRVRSRSAQDALADASALASEAISSVRTVQAHAAEGRLSTRFAAATDRAFEAARHSVVARGLLTTFAIFVIFSSVVLVLWYGANEVRTGGMTAGELGQFVLYAVFAAGALGEVVQVFGEVAQAVGAADRLCGLLKVDITILRQNGDSAGDKTSASFPLPNGNSEMSPANGRGGGGHLVIDHVGFRYPREEGEALTQPVLRDASFEVLPGQTVAIVGPSGAGKSTLLHLLMRFYDMERGDIRINGVSVTDYDPSALRSKMALVPQAVDIFAGTVRDNVAFARPDASDDDIHNALTAANAAGFVYALADGVETLLGERGVNLSGGQRQRIAIARAVLQDAPILLLDEATSALDAESEHLVQDALDRLMEGRTVVVIAHRLATVRNADRIIVLDGGRVVEDGTHDTLSASGGLYARLARLQFSDLISEEPTKGARATVPSA
ncbi:MAG: ABC transporter transmembrane domain-containing protein [Pseudomonadota bacterium]